MKSIEKYNKIFQVFLTKEFIYIMFNEKDVLFFINNMIFSDKISIKHNNIIRELKEIFSYKTQFFSEKKRLKDYINQGNLILGTKELFKIIFRFFRYKNKTGFTEFNEFRKLVKSLNIRKLSFNYVITILSKQLKQKLNINKKIQLIYTLSLIQEKKYRKIEKKRILEKNIREGDIILLNKKTKKIDIGSKLLRAYDSRFKTVFTHSAIVISKKEIKIRHATMFPQNNKKQGIVEETNLFNYLHTTGTKSCDVLVLRTDNKIKKEILDFSKSNLGKKYDYAAALSGGLRGIASEKSTIFGGFKKNKTGTKNDAFNCVEIITQSLKDQKIKHITHPNEFLEHINIFKPVYMTTIKV